MSAARGWLLALDTATSTALVAAGDLDGTLLASEPFAARHHHTQELLPALDRLRAAGGRSMDELRGVVVGIGPGAFTGLRVGLATAKTIAHELRLPIVGVSTAEALLAAAAAAGGADARGAARLWLPGGPHDRVVVEPGGRPRLVTGTPGADPDEPRPGDVAVDLDGRAPAEALAVGRAAVAGLATALVRIGAERLLGGRADDLERLVPEYVTLPRGVARGLDLDRGVAWSHDHP